jgi:hypothetical protein
VGVPDNPDPEAAAAIRRLLGRCHESALDHLDQLSDAQIGDVFIAEGISDRQIACEVLVARNIRARYGLESLPHDESVEDLVRAGDMDEQDWTFCFLIEPAAIDDYLREMYGIAYGE